jgi:hypothetical protein
MLFSTVGASFISLNDIYSVVDNSVFNVNVTLTDISTGETLFYYTAEGDGIFYVDQEIPQPFPNGYYIPASLLGSNNPGYGFLPDLSSPVPVTQFLVLTVLPYPST